MLRNGQTPQMRRAGCLVNIVCATVARHTPDHFRSDLKCQTKGEQYPSGTKQSVGWNEEAWGWLRAGTHWLDLQDPRQRAFTPCQNKECLHISFHRDLLALAAKVEISLNWSVIFCMTCRISRASETTRIWTRSALSIGVRIRPSSVQVPTLS